MARPPQFERDAVLHKAMDAFWAHGYAGTGVADLVKVTGLKPGSLYGAFQSKEALFLQALELYTQQSLARLDAQLGSAASPLHGVRAYFHALARDVAGADAARGCLLVNTVLEIGRQDEKMREHVNAHLARIEARLRTALQAARAQGELSADKDPTALAALLMTGIWGLRVLAGTAPGQARAHMVVEQLLEALD